MMRNQWLIYCGSLRRCPAPKHRRAIRTNTPCVRRLEIVIFSTLLATAVCISGCQLPGSLARSDDSLSERLNSPLNGDLHFAGTESGMNAPAAADFQEPVEGPAEGRWAGFWSKLKPSKPLALPRTDFWSPDEGASEPDEDSSLNSGF